MCAWMHAKTTAGYFIAILWPPVKALPTLQSVPAMSEYEYFRYIEYQLFKNSADCLII